MAVPILLRGNEASVVKKKGSVKIESAAMTIL
jgi:hypothetical protein